MQAYSVADDEESARLLADSATLRIDMIVKIGTSGLSDRSASGIVRGTEAWARSTDGIVKEEAHDRRKILESPFDFLPDFHTLHDDHQRFGSTGGPVA